MRYAINGLLSLTCDGLPILGESEVDGALDRRRGLDQGGPGRRPRGRRVDDPRLERDRRQPQRHRAVPRAPEAPRAHPAAHHRVVHQDLRHHPPGRAVRVRPRPAARPRCTTPSRSSARSSSRPPAGSGRTGTSPTPASLEEYGDAVMPREHEWDSRWWSPIINAEHLRMREAAGVIDLTAFQIFDIEGAGALDSVQRTCVAQCDVAVGKVIYTPVLDANGGFRSDLTVMRLGDDHFRVVTGGAHGLADRKWFPDHLVGEATLTDRTDDVSTIGLWGPKARDILASLTDADVSDEGFASSPAARSRSAARPCSPRGSPTSASSAGSSTSSMDDAAAALGGAARHRRRATAPCRSASASTAPPAGSRRATAPTATSSTASAPSSRPPCSGPRSRPPTSSAGRPTSPSARRLRRRCCAR